jgi:hypothetical protein
VRIVNVLGPEAVTVPRMVLPGWNPENAPGSSCARACHDVTTNVSVIAVQRRVGLLVMYMAAGMHLGRRRLRDGGRSSCFSLRNMLETGKQRRSFALLRMTTLE